MNNGRLLYLTVFLTGWCCGPATAAGLIVLPAEVRLAAPDDRQRLVVLTTSQGHRFDVTGDVTWESADPQIATVTDAGLVRPVSRGQTRIRISGRGMTAEVPVTVGDLDRLQPVSFVNDVMAVLGRSGCNSGACHGHGKGKGGFKLSLRGYDPAADFAALTEADSGRVDTGEPEESLILQMPTEQLDHGGGKRFEVDSQAYRTLQRWIAAGAKSDIGRATALQRIEVLPASRMMPLNVTLPGETDEAPADRSGPRRQQLVVLAHFADGTRRDVTHQAVFDVSDEGVLQVDQHGLVTCHAEGEAAVFVRFLDQMGLSRFDVPRHRADFVWPDPPAANFIDTHVYNKLRQIHVTPSELASDAEFLRRVTLDCTGLPPTADEVRGFLQDKAPDKRRRKIDELLSRPEFGEQWANYWLERSGVTESGTSARFKGVWTFHFWLRDAVNANMPYDRFVRAAVAGRGSSLHDPSLTFATHQLPKVETVPQLFLGVRLNCAQCHDHPFDVWKQRDHQALGAFFEGLGNKEGPLDSYGREIRRFVPPEKFLPWERGKTITLRFPDGSTGEIPVTRDRRDALVDWMFGPGKKMTARALVNRVWGRYFGRGIIDPVDDMRFSNPAVNPPLLDALADDFIAHDYDFKHLVRTILNSRTWQLSSKPNEFNRHDTTNFSHALLRRLSAEQLLDSIVQVTGVDEDFHLGPPGLKAVSLPYAGVSSRFLTIFGRPGERMSACECTRSSGTTLPQIMHFVAGDTVMEKVRSEDGRLVTLLAAHPDDRELLDAIYLTVLSRFPTADERELGLRYLAGSDTRTAGAEDLLWALLTSREFLFNH